MVVTALAGVLLGLGGVTAGTSLVQASERGGLFDFFEDLFHGPGRRVQAEPLRVAPRRPPVRYSALPDAGRVTAVHAPRRTWPAPVVRARTRRLPASTALAATAVTRGALGARTVCVRTCDGYLFPVGTLASPADLPVHAAACAAACPGAPTRLFTLGASQTEMDRAIDLDGRPYRGLPVANLYRTRRVERCACQPEGYAATLLPFDRDLTLRAGDVLATPSSAQVVTVARGGAVVAVDFRDAKGLSRRARRAIDAKIDVVRREADAQTFQRAMRMAERGNRVRVAGIGGFEPVAAPIETEASFAQVRVVVPSPFVY